MKEEMFIDRMQMGLDPKLFSRALKTNKRNLKQRRNNNEAGSIETTTQTTETADVNNQEENNMAKINEQRMEQKYRQNQSNNDKAAQRQASRKLVSTLEDMSVLENKKVTIAGEISDKEKELNEVTQIQCRHCFYMYYN